MRKKKKNSRLMPFAAGFFAGFGILAVISGIAALILLITDAAAASAAAAIIAIAAGSFVSGRVVGKMRRKNGIKSGVLCGIIFIAPILLLSILFGEAGSFMMFVKIALSIIFGAAGGVSGVNAQDG